MTVRNLKIAAGAIAALVAAAVPAAAFERAHLARYAQSGEQAVFDVYLPLQNTAALDALLAEQTDAHSASYHRWLTPAAFNARFGPDGAARARITAALRGSGLRVSDAGGRRLRVTGPVRIVEAALGTRLAHATFASGRDILAAVVPMTPIAALRDAGAVIADFSGVARFHAHALPAAMIQPDNRTSSTGAYWFDDLKQAYDFPSYQVYSGRGVTIGILMSGGYNPSDMARYFNHEQLSVPSIGEVTVDGGERYSYFNSLETHLDIQQAGGMAPNAAITLYNIPDLTDASILDGLARIVQDNQVDIVSMSFGAAELAYTAAYNDNVDQTSILGSYHDLFRQGNAQGITFVASSGDLGSRDIPAAACFLPGATAACGRFLQSVETPASDPNVTGVGGTNLVTAHQTGSLNSAYVSESAFTDPLASDIFYGTPAVTGAAWGSGGGKSMIYPQPGYQAGVTTYTAWRAVPDVAMQMGGCPSGASRCGALDSSVICVVAGQQIALVGTSAAAPEFAGLLALKIEALGGGRLGNENIDLYSLAVAQAKGGATVFRNTIQGENGGYVTRKNYNEVVGNGTVFGRAFVLAPTAPPAGIPQTASNP